MPIRSPLPSYLGHRWWLFFVLVLFVAWICVPTPDQLATRLLENGEGRRAAKLIEQALVTNTDPALASELHEKMATAMLMEGDHEKALFHQEKAVQQVPDSIKELVRLSDLYETMCQPRKAMDALEKAVGLYRSFREKGEFDVMDLARLMSVLGSGEPPTRENLTRRFEESFSTYRRKLAWYYRWFQKLQPALRLHRELVVDHPDDAATWEYLAQLESYAGNETGAQKALEVLARLRPKETYVRGMLAARYQWNKLPEKAMEQSVLAGGTPDEVRRRVLAAYVQCGRGEEGLAEYLRRYPGDHDPRGAQLMLAEVMVDEHDLKGARRVLEKLAAALPDDEEVLDKLAEVQARMGDMAAASATYMLLVQRRPERESYVRKAIEASDGARDEKRSLELLSRLHASHPEDDSVSRELAIRYVQGARYAEAEPLLTRIVKDHPDDENALFHLALLYGDTGRQDRATAIYERLLAMGSTKSQPDRRPTTATAAAAAVDPGFPVAAAPKPGPVPRRVLAFYRKADSETPDRNKIYLWVAFVLNHLGLTVDYRDAEDPLPSEKEMSAYRGIVTWFMTDQMRGAERFALWLADQPYRNRPVVVFERFGCAAEPGGKAIATRSLERLQRALGITIGSRSTENPARIEVARSEPAMVEFERPLAYELDLWADVRSVNPANKVYLTLKRRDIPDALCDAVVVGPGGAYIIPTYGLYHNLETARTQWRVDPFRLFTEAFRLQGLPRMDYTTRLGRRMLYLHVDGDGSEQLCRWDPGRTCAAKLLEVVAAKPHLPIGISFIAALVDPDASADPVGTELVRRFAALEHVEIAHHSYSHPLDWTTDQVVVKAPGYSKMMDPQREIVGAAQALQKIIGDPGRKVDLCFWSGACNPTRRELEIASKAGQLAINGGQPRFDGNFPSVSHLASVFRMVDDKEQVLTSAANDYFLTDRWDLPIVAFKNVIQTYERSGSPRRLTPVNLYYHFYLLAEEAGARTLAEIYDWIERQPFHPVPVSEYIRTALGFRSARVTDEGGGRWKVANAGRCLTVRFDAEAREVDQEKSQGVIGSVRDSKTLYVHLDGSGEAVIVLREGKGSTAVPQIETSSVPIESFKVQGSSVSFDTAGTGQRHVALSGFPPSTSLDVITRSGANRPAKKVSVPVTPDGAANVLLELNGRNQIEIAPASEEPR